MDIVPCMPAVGLMGDDEAIPKAARVSVPSTGVAAGSATSDGPSGLGGMVDLGLSPAGGLPFFVLGFFCVFFWIVRRRRYPEGRIRSSLSYPRSVGAPIASRGHVESCVGWIFSDLLGFDVW
jgi:hypothetical protein